MLNGHCAKIPQNPEPWSTVQDTLSPNPDRVASMGREATPGEARKAAGHFVAAIMNRKLDLKGWQLVVTGHSLGAGAAALIALKLYGRFPGDSHPSRIFIQLFYSSFLLHPPSILVYSDYFCIFGGVVLSPFLP